MSPRLQWFQHGCACSLGPPNPHNLQPHVLACTCDHCSLQFQGNLSDHQLWCSGPPNTLKSSHSKSLRSWNAPNQSACSIWFAMQPTEHLSCVPHPIASPTPKKPFHTSSRYILNIPRPSAPQSTSSAPKSQPLPVIARATRQTLQNHSSLLDTTHVCMLRQSVQMDFLLGRQTHSEHRSGHSMCRGAATHVTVMHGARCMRECVTTNMAETG